jgi:hypothetical protein
MYFLMFLIVAADRLGFGFYNGALFDPRHSTYFHRFIGLILLCTATDATAVWLSGFWNVLKYYLQPSFWYMMDNNVNPSPEDKVFKAIWPTLKSFFVLEFCFGYVYCLV